jgi:hypothetical protein
VSIPPSSSSGCAVTCSMRAVVCNRSSISLKPDAPLSWGSGWSGSCGSESCALGAGGFECALVALLGADPPRAEAVNKYAMTINIASSACKERGQRRRPDPARAKHLEFG